MGAPVVKLLAAKRASDNCELVHAMIVAKQEGHESCARSCHDLARAPFVSEHQGSTDLPSRRVGTSHLEPVKLNEITKAIKMCLCAFVVLNLPDLT